MTDIDTKLNKKGLDVFREEATNDLSIDITKLMSVASEHVSLTGKWLDRTIKAKKDVATIEHLYKKNYKEKWGYYAGISVQPEDEVFNQDLGSPQVIKIYVEGDDDTLAIASKVRAAKIRLEFFEGILEAMKSKNYIISNMIKYDIFQNGG